MTTQTNRNQLFRPTLYPTNENQRHLKLFLTNLLERVALVNIFFSGAIS